MGAAHSRLFDVEGRIVVITGGSRGIGAMIASAYVEHGARVILSARRADDVEAMASKLGERATALPADLSRMDAIDRFAAQVGRVAGKVDILFNNAGATWGAPFDDYPEQGWDKVLDINLKSPFFLSQRLTPLLEKAAKAEAPARIVNIGSIDGLHVNPIESYAYAASKAGIHHLTRMMAKALGPRHILVNAIAPGFFPSKMTAGIADEWGPEIRRATPLGRWGEPDDIGGVALFLGARASAFMTGAVIPVDGGYATTA